MFCPNCRAQLPDGLSVCPVCNGHLNTIPMFHDSNGSAVAAFVMALLSIFLPILTLPALICGHIGLSHSQQTSSRTGFGLAVAALVIGYLTVAGWLLIVLFLCGLFSVIAANM